MRTINDEGIEWLENENKLKSSLIKSSGLVRNNEASRSSDSSSRNATRGESSSLVDDLTKKKFEKFLKGSKK